MRNTKKEILESLGISGLFCGFLFAVDTSWTLLYGLERDPQESREGKAVGNRRVMVVGV